MTEATAMSTADEQRSAETKVPDRALTDMAAGFSPEWPKRAVASKAALSFQKTRKNWY
jgi:hypothetical protein